MGVTPDRRAGPLLEEEIQMEDRGPGGDSSGDPTIEGALRRITNALRVGVGGAVRQVRPIKNPPAGFADADMSGILDGEGLNYNAATKQLEPGAAGGGVSPSGHRNLDQLVHLISEDSHTQITRVAGRITNITVWTDNTETTKIRETALTRTAGLISQTVTTHYDGAGVPIAGEVFTRDFNRVSGRVDSIDGALT